MTGVILYVMLLALLAFFLGGLVVVVQRMRPSCRWTFTLLLVAAALWALFHAGELLARTETAKVLVVDGMYVAISLTSLGWLLFTIEYSGFSRWLTPWRIAGLAAFFPVALAVIWTNPRHHLFFRTLTVAAEGPFPSATAVAYGPLFWVYVVYAYGLMLAGLVLLLWALMRSPQLYRGQIGWLITGALVPFMFSIAQVSGLNPGRYVDITPLGFSITGLAFGRAVLRSRLFSIVPIARDMVIENMTDGVIVIDAEDRVVDINPAAEAIVGRRAAQVVGRTVQEVVARRPDLVQRYHETLEALDEIEVGQGATRRTYEMRLSPIYTRRKELTGRLVMLRDITDSKQLQQQRQRQLRETLTMNRVLAAATSSLDRDAMLTTICREIVQALGLAQAAVAVLNEEGTTLTITAEHLSEGRESVVGRQLVPGSDLASSLLERREMVVIRDVQHDPRVAATAFPGSASRIIVPLTIRDRVIGTMGLDSAEQRDFTPDELQLVEKVVAAVSQVLESARLHEALQTELAERRRAQAELEIARDAAEAASRAKSAFLASMSHELRTPLNSIIGYMELLMRGVYGPVNDRQMARMETVLRSGNQLLNLINDVLDLSKIEAGRVDLDLQPVPVRLVLEECLSAIEPQAVIKGLAVYREWPDDLPEALADLGRLRQVINNLLSNAVKFTPAGSVTVRACTLEPDEMNRVEGVPRRGRSVLISVVDSGIGIAPEDQAIIFDEFRQVDSSTTRQYEGTGLGLAIARRLVEAMDGRIWVESEPGMGSSFFVMLPAAKTSGR